MHWCDGRIVPGWHLSSAAQFGPPPNAPLSLEKLSRIDEFLNDQVAQGENTRAPSS
jgi:hypothetical protein